MNIEELRSAVQEASGLIQSLSTIQEAMAPLIEQAEEIIRQSEAVAVTPEMLQEIQNAGDLASELQDSVDDVRNNLPDLDDIRTSAQEIIDACENMSYGASPSRQLDDLEERLGTLHGTLSDISRKLTEARVHQLQGQTTPPQPGEPSPTVEPHPGRRH